VIAIKDASNVLSSAWERLTPQSAAVATTIMTSAIYEHNRQDDDYYIILSLCYFLLSSCYLLRDSWIFFDKIIILSLTFIF